jgi:voltage-gated potassium channel Kch
MDEPATPRVGAGHVVLCGLNELGYRTLEELSRMGAEVVVVVRAADADLAAGARALGATLVQGSCRDESVLRAAGVPAAAALVVTEDDDVGNLHAALTAHDRWGAGGGRAPRRARDRAGLDRGRRRRRPRRHRLDD